MKYSREDVIKKLETYPEKVKMADVLRYEIAHPAQIAPDELIDAMTFGHGDSEGHGSGTVSNKTMYIALNYQDAADKMNREVADDIACRLVSLERELSRLRYYMGLLDQRKRRVVELYYFERKSWERVGNELQLSVKTLRKLRNEAVDALLNMYRFADGVDGE